MKKKIINKKNYLKYLKKKKNKKKKHTYNEV